MAITGLQTSFTPTQAPGMVGTLINGVIVESYRNLGGLTAQSVQVDIGTIAASTAYTLNVDGTTVTVTSAATGETAATLQAKLLTALRNSFAGSNFTFAPVAATGITILSRLAGIATTVTVSGGGAGFAINAGAGVASAQPTKIPFGLVVARKAGDDVRGCRLPTAVADIILGFSVASHARELNDGILPGAAVGVVRSGSLYAWAEEPITEDSPLLYRRAVNGNLTQLGTVAVTAGTGLTALTGCAAKGSSFIFDGRFGVEVSVNLA
jgi:hypothetical protein